MQDATQELREAEARLRQLYGDAARPFMEDCDKIYKRKLEKITAKHQEGKGALSEAEAQIMAEMARLSKELASIRQKKTEVDRAAEKALHEAVKAKQASIDEFMERQEQIVKQEIDSKLNRRRG